QPLSKLESNLSRMTTSADTGFDFQKRRSDSRHERSSLADRRPAENEDAMTLLILGVKVGAHHFPSNRPIPRCAATAAKQIGRRVPPPTARSAGACRSIAAWS